MERFLSETGQNTFLNISSKKKNKLGTFLCFVAKIKDISFSLTLLLGNVQNSGGKRYKRLAGFIPTEKTEEKE